MIRLGGVLVLRRLFRCPFLAFGTLTIMPSLLEPCRLVGTVYPDVALLRQAAFWRGENGIVSLQMIDFLEFYSVKIFLCLRSALCLL